jgi:hypothetical protein
MLVIVCCVLKVPLCACCWCVLVGWWLAHQVVGPARANTRASGGWIAESDQAVTNACVVKAINIMTMSRDEITLVVSIDPCKPGWDKQPSHLPYGLHVFTYYASGFEAVCLLQWLDHAVCKLHLEMNSVLLIPFPGSAWLYYAINCVLKACAYYNYSVSYYGVYLGSS